MQKLPVLLQSLLINGRDMLPVVAVIAAFQYLVIGEPFAQISQLLLGGLMVLVGLTLFVQGMSMSLFPLGETMITSLTYKGNLSLLMAFAFCIGAGSTIAEPALIAVTQEASSAAFTSYGDAVVQRNAWILRTACALAVGVAVTVGAVFVIKGWHTGRLVVGGYLLATLAALLTGSPLTAIALDAGAAATSAINIPLISTLGVGLASLIKGRNPVTDGFGLVALCSIMPVLVLLLASGFLV